jgi:uncharacterized protein (DUF1697 family)
MAYVALLRGINVGGNRKVDMKRLKAVFEEAIVREFGFEVKVLLRDIDAMRALVAAISSDWTNRND